MGTERDTAILSLSRTVHYLAYVYSQRFGVAQDELVGVAWEGAIRAVDSYRPDRGTALPSYATWRIRSALLDYARQQDHVSRNTRRRITQGSLPAGEYERPVSLDCELAEHPTLMATLESEREEWEPEPTVLLADRDAQLRAAVAALPERERIIIEQFDLVDAGVTLRELGELFGVTESRISQIRKQALDQLRDALAD
ncbi:MAG TPA: sigma-70 family RNA polymerase sigma factor [Solirubrobacteraceae bacterium]|nr:sigma-70 family RNA polymerase sigma factor [Solirubrobacteraceae bacterium]